MLDLQTILVFALLNFPPLWTFAGFKIIKRHHFIAQPEFLLPLFSTISIGLLLIWIFDGFSSTLQISIGNNAHMHYMFLGAFIYIGIFMFYAIYTKLNYFNRDEFLHPAYSFALSIFAVYSIAELWELPIHMTNWATGIEALQVGLMLSLPKLIALPLYFYFLLRAGWHPDTLFFLILFTSLIWGGLLYMVINEGAVMVAQNVYFFQTYRLIWAALFIESFIRTPKEKMR